MSSDSEIYEEALAGITSKLNSSFEVKYIDIILAQDAGLTSFSRKVDKEENIIISVGPKATSLAIKNFYKAQIIFTMVNSPKIFNISRNNICGISMDISIKNYFQILKELKPTLQKVHAFYSSPAGKYQIGEGSYRDLEFNFIFSEQKLQADEDLSFYFDSLLENKIEAVYIPNDPIYTRRNFEKLSAFAQKNGIILMTSFARLVRKGSTFGFSPDFTNLGVLTAEKANGFALEKDCGNRKVVTSTEANFYFNFAFARSSGLQIPEKIHLKEKTTKLKRLGIRLLNQKKYRSANKVFDHLLEKDAHNASARYYKNLIAQRQNQHILSESHRRAKILYRQNRFKLALAEYNKILKVASNDMLARRGKRKCLTKLASLEFNNGLRREKNKNNFAAMRHYLRAINYDGGHVEARQRLNNLKQGEISQLSKRLNKAIGLHNRREYEKAIVIFNNILLVEPGNRKANAYLKLSVKKLRAAEALLKNSN